MSEHKVDLRWSRGDHGFDYKEYSRNHHWSFPNGLKFEASAAAKFLGDTTKIDPEAAFVGSLSSCHLLSFLAICSRKGILVESYADHAVGFLEKNHEGKLVVNRVELHPITHFGDGVNLSDREIKVLHHEAHTECFLANSVKTKIETIIC
ncbi:MAG: OsmC family protein [Verrucomicrobiota bacterium]